MNNFIKRLQRLWLLSKKDQDALDDFMKLTGKEIMDLPDEDQKGVFFGEGTDEEFKDHENEKKGIKGIFGL